MEGDIKKMLASYKAMYLDMPGDPEQQADAAYDTEHQKEQQLLGDDHEYQEEQDALNDDSDDEMDVNAENEVDDTDMDEEEDGNAENEDDDIDMDEEEDGNAENKDEDAEKQDDGAENEDDKMEDNELKLHTETECQALVNDLFKMTLDTFGLETAKRIIFAGCRANEIELFVKKSRSANSVMDCLNIEDVKQKMSVFPSASADITLNLQPNDSQDNILRNCTTVNSKIIGMDANKELSSVYTFGLYYQMRQNINAAKRLPNYKKEFLPALREKLNGNNPKKMTDARFSKHLRKYERVEQLVDAVGSRAGGFLLGMYITVYSLENDTQEDWTVLLESLKKNLEYLAFVMTLTLADDGMTPMYIEIY